jgi:hypothetical protein
LFDASAAGREADPSSSLAGGKEGIQALIGRVIGGNCDKTFSSSLAIFDMFNIIDRNSSPRILSPLADLRELPRSRPALNKASTHSLNPFRFDIVGGRLDSSLVIYGDLESALTLTVAAKADDGFLALIRAFFNDSEFSKNIMPVRDKRNKLHIFEGSICPDLRCSQPSSC